MASQLWRALSPEHKSRYEAMFKVDQARYRREKVSSATAPAVGFSMPATSPSLPPADPAPDREAPPPLPLLPPVSREYSAAHALSSLSRFASTLAPRRAAAPASPALCALSHCSKGESSDEDFNAAVLVAMATSPVPEAPPVDRRARCRAVQRRDGVRSADVSAAVSPTMSATASPLLIPVGAMSAGLSPLLAPATAAGGGVPPVLMPAASGGGGVAQRMATSMATSMSSVCISPLSPAALPHAAVGAFDALPFSTSSPMLTPPPMPAAAADAAALQLPASAVPMD